MPNDKPDSRERELLRECRDTLATIPLISNLRHVGEHLVTRIDALFSQPPAQAGSGRDDALELPAQVVVMCKRRGWSMHWTHRGAYLHLESSELIEAIRGKRGDPLKEAADVLLVLMSITEYAGITWASVVAQAQSKCDELMTKPHYPGEEFQPHPPAAPAQPEQGWVLVPREPTDAMYAAAKREWDGRMSARSAGVWKAMLSALSDSNEGTGGVTEIRIRWLIRTRAPLKLEGNGLWFPDTPQTRSALTAFCDVGNNEYQPDPYFGTQPTHWIEERPA